MKAFNFIFYHRLMLCVVCLLPIFFTVNAAELTKIRAIADNRIELHGDFGKDCKRCEIVVDYGKGFKYAYRPERWRVDKLVFTAKDLGRATRVKITVTTSSDKTRALAYRLKLKLSPSRMPSRAVATSKIDNKFIYAENHQDGFGGKGLDEFNYAQPSSSCGKKSEVFHKAGIVIVKKRFGDARIEKQAVSGCKNCGPIKVRWYHEPTGQINYQLHIQRRIIEVECQKVIRR